MAAIKFSRKEFEKHFKLTEELKEKINLFGTHLENVTNDEIELEILPNRPDLYSLQGFVRAFSIFLGKNKNKEYKIKKSDAKIIVDPIMKSIRPYSMAIIVKGIKFTNENIKDIMQWQEKIHATIGRNRKKIALGYYVLDKIKFPVKYTARPPKEIKFIPLETNEEMNGLQILQSHPTGREYANQLENFDEFPVYYDSNKNVLSMPPIINSNDSGKITPGVSDVLIECSGTDLDTLKKAISLAACDLIEAGGEAHRVEIIYGAKKEFIDFEPEKLKLNTENVKKILGLDLKDEEIKKLLEKMGYNYNTKSKEAEIPAWRTDIMHEVDLIEDIAIAYGYEKIVPEIPSIATTGEVSKTETIKRKIAEILLGLSILETSSYHMLTLDDVKQFSLKDCVEVEDSKSEYKSLRPNLSIMLLKILKENVDVEYPQRIFELGKIFKKDDKEETGIKETEKLAIAIADTNANFTTMKQILDYLMRMLGKNYSLENQSNEKTFIEGRSAKIMLEGKEIGSFGEVSPQILSNLKIKMPVALLELDIEQLCE
jgi:phenylalanyl-tRNA synthetase beta chain